jgi:hypothetical protein
MLANGNICLGFSAKFTAVKAVCGNLPSGFGINGAMTQWAEHPIASNSGTTTPMAFPKFPETAQTLCLEDVPHAGAEELDRSGLLI